ncbi:hypothetical protein BJ322DRAFT_494844 [Thelephora terrestris]|uniref:F-box domain-containing protein n=1 Tax=Thelephora terrestris TaxID=56493 RepID=A0A9P6L1B2_9AGAM|nr:hypothetical protein BJ322DRAFT_494844 [Thelephora terrestris]
MSYDQGTMPPSDYPNSDKLSQQDRPVNIKSIRAIEEQIREHETAIIQLKRARNSLLNVSKLPAEILGDIFRWNTTLKKEFGPSEKRSHNFLFVCHHWFEVASRTPEVWSFWGSDLEDWTRRHLLHPTVPLNLVFNGDLKDYRFDDSLAKCTPGSSRAGHHTAGSFPYQRFRVSGVYTLFASLLRWDSD